MRESRRDGLDDALDRALASYGEAPERDGLERRVLAKVNERATRRHPVRGFAIAAIGAAAAAVCWLLWPEMPKTAVHPKPAVTALSMRTIPPRDAAVVLPRAAKRRHIPKKPVEPKLAQFPAPSPMSGEERALVRLATGDPKNIPRELMHSGDPIEPLRIEAIEIKPLE